MDSIGKRLFYIRKNILSMSQKDFSELLGISQGALSEVEHDNRGLPIEAMVELSKYSKQNNSFSTDWLLTGYNNITKNISPHLTPHEQELLDTYGHLDSRGQHRVHTVIYEELDRIDRETAKKDRSGIG